ncbi:MAG: hypothetical protein DWH91_17445 [Planctomycetota bacterium]|nr:MAG: hypothetical protein DWH91_17445 [Planctomycetota bacterium]
MTIRFPTAAWRHGSPLTHAVRTICGGWFALMLLTGMTGCVSIGIWPNRPGIVQTEPPLSPTATAEEVLARVNKNCYSEFSPEGLRRYRCDDMRVTMKGVPVPLKASMIIEAPRNLRIRVSAPLTGGEGLDVGSNDEQFWYWSNHSQPENVLLCNHDHVSYATQVMSLPLPFRPDWLMEVLGVMPISGKDFQVQRANARSSIAELVSIERLPNQQAVRRIAKIDTRLGIILEHRVESLEGQMIAKATLTRHLRDPQSRLVLPREFRIEWPAAGQNLSLTMELNTIEFNPSAEPVAMWQPPQINGSPSLDIGLLALRELGIKASDIPSSSASREIPETPGSALMEDDSEPAGPFDGVAGSPANDDEWELDEDHLPPIGRGIRQSASTLTSQGAAPLFEEPPAIDTVPATEASSDNARPFPD